MPLDPSITSPRSPGSPGRISPRSLPARGPHEQRPMAFVRAPFLPSQPGCSSTHVTAICFTVREAP
jgi:hypothetical protein